MWIQALNSVHNQYPVASANPGRISIRSLVKITFPRVRLSTYFHKIVNRNANEVGEKKSLIPFMKKVV